MSNMSYCRFGNTYADLHDCFCSMEDENLSPTEIKARKKLVRLCIDIACAYGEEVGFVCEVVREIPEKQIVK